MPIITIKLAAGASVEGKEALLSGMREALLEAFSIGDGSCYALLDEYPPERLIFPAWESGAVLVEVRCFPGRGAAQKERFYALAAQAAEQAGFVARSLLVMMVEPPLVIWGLMGGKSAATVPGLGADTN